MVVVHAAGEIEVFGQAANDLEALKTALLDSLSRMEVLPEKIDIQFDDAVDSNLRQKIEALAAAAVAAARQAKLVPTVEMLSFRKSQGSDCDQPDTLRTDCARIDLQYPDVVKGEKALQDSVRQWAKSCMAGIISQGYDPTSQTTDLEQAAKEFFSSQTDYKGTPLGGLIEASSTAKVLLNDGRHLTLAIKGYSFQGGAHGNHGHTMGTFDVQTGRMLTWDDLVTSVDALLFLAEKKVREVKSEAFESGFNFDETFPFALASSYALTQEGILLYYVPYEIMPYAYGTTEVLLTFEELGELSKVTF